MADAGEVTRSPGGDGNPILPSSLVKRMLILVAFLAAPWLARFSETINAVGASVGRMEAAAGRARIPWGGILLFVGIPCLKLLTASLGTPFGPIDWDSQLPVHMEQTGPMASFVSASQSAKVAACVVWAAGLAICFGWTRCKRVNQTRSFPFSLLGGALFAVGCVFLFLSAFGITDLDVNRHLIAQNREIHFVDMSIQLREGFVESGLVPVVLESAIGIYCIFHSYYLRFRSRARPRDVRKSAVGVLPPSAPGSA